MTRAVDFFWLFITVELLREICLHTNSYGWATIAEKSYYGDKEGAWKETNPDKIEKLIALILYCGLVKVSRSTATGAHSLCITVSGQEVSC